MHEIKIKGLSNPKWVAARMLTMKPTIFTIGIFLLATLFLSYKGSTPVVQMSVSPNDEPGSEEDETCYGCGDCSMYCEIENKYSVTASSSLPKQGNNEYSPLQLDDYNLRTAWFEGKSDYGIGEWFEFNFSKFDFTKSNTQIDGLYLFNGYRKSITHWRDNSRIKKLLMSVNGQEFLILELANTYKFQHVDFKHIKMKDVKTINFRILEVYNGEKYSDVGLSEIKFTGIHHH